MTVVTIGKAGPALGRADGNLQIILVEVFLQSGLKQYASHGFPIFLQSFLKQLEPKSSV